PAPKRLKHLAEHLGETRLRELIEQERSRHPQSLPFQSLEPALTAVPEPVEWTEFPIFAGELSSSLLRRLAMTIREQGDGFLLLTANQNLACADPQGLIRRPWRPSCPPPPTGRNIAAASASAISCAKWGWLQPANWPARSWTP
ncbi:MAG: hypothetical protein P8X63_12380, partial [Desulfuromonadaceae bacterium]